MIPPQNPPAYGLLRYVPRYRPRMTYIMMGILVVVFVVETLAVASARRRWMSAAVQDLFRRRIV